MPVLRVVARITCLEGDSEQGLCGNPPRQQRALGQAQWEKASCAPEADHSWVAHALEGFRALVLTAVSSACSGAGIPHLSCVKWSPLEYYCYDSMMQNHDKNKRYLFFHFLLSKGVYLDAEGHTFERG